jgi:predicted ATPase/Tfp pilus assembly protein PilF
VNVPAFLFAEFDQVIDGSGSSAPSIAQLLFALREPLERALIDHGCRWFKPKGKRLYAVMEKEQVLVAIVQTLRDLAKNVPNSVPMPFKWVVHCGDAFQGSSGWFGPEFEHASRLLDAASPGFPILSESASLLPTPEGYHLMSLGMHMLKDLRPSEELFAFHPADLTHMDFSIPRSMGARSHNLPPQATPFVGRNEALLDLGRQLIADDTRMVTLLGPGGFGKTRLALQVAADLVDEFEGVYWVPLAPLTSEERLTSALADSLGVVFYKGEDPFQKVLEVLTEHRTLLLFDNFEHLTSGRDYVKRILEATPSKVIVTSRESLRIPQEKVVEVLGLKYPERADDGLFDEYGATQLFVSSLTRIGRVEPLDRTEKEAFVVLCRQLHGMPLGIEMSAALAANQALPEIVRQLRERIDYLAVALPHLPDRQKSTRAVFEYSWNLLDEPLRKALGRLSIIRGTFDDAAAMQVADCDNHALRQLHERSLVVFLPDGRQELHETVRYYAKEHLYEDPVEREKSLESHAKFYLSYFRDSLPLFEGPDQRKNLEAANEHNENAQVAFVWAIEKGRWQWVDETLEAYSLFLDRLAKYQDGFTFFAKLLKNLEERIDSPKDPEQNLLRVNLLLWRASLGVRMGLNEGAEVHLEECLKVFKGKKYERRRAETLLVLGQVLEARSKKAESIDCLSHALAQFEACKDLNGAAYARNRLGQGLLQWGQVGTAAALVREALEHYEKTKNPSGMAWSRMLLGQMAVHEAKYDEAKRHFREGLEGYLAVGNRDGVSWAMSQMGLVARYRGDFAGAKQLFLEALNIEREISNHGAQGWSYLNLGETEWYLGNDDKADQQAHRSLEIFIQLEDKAGIAAALRWKGIMTLERGAVDEAERVFLDSEQEGDFLSDPAARAYQNYHLAMVAQKRGQLKDAEESLGRALETFKKTHYLFGLGWGYHLTAELAIQKGDLERAKHFLWESLKVGKALGVAPLLLECWLVWAAILATQEDFLGAMEYVEAVTQSPQCSKPTARKAALLRDECEIKLNIEEKAFARRGAVAADIGIWTDRILEKETTKITFPRRRPKPKPKPRPKPIRKKK